MLARRPDRRGLKRNGERLADGEIATKILDEQIVKVQQESLAFARDMGVDRRGVAVFNIVPELYEESRLLLTATCAAPGQKLATHVPSSHAFLSPSMIFGRPSLSV